MLKNNLENLELDRLENESRKLVAERKKLLAEEKSLIERQIYIHLQ